MREQSSTAAAAAFIATRFGASYRLLGTQAVPQAVQILAAALAL